MAKVKSIIMCHESLSNRKWLGDNESDSLLHLSRLLKSPLSNDR